LKELRRHAHTLAVARAELLVVGDSHDVREDTRIRSVCQPGGGV
jgi:hypothetical protein